jgi:hypothetical protein
LKLVTDIVSVVEIYDVVVEVRAWQVSQNSFDVVIVVDVTCSPFTMYTEIDVVEPVWISGTI